MTILNRARVVTPTTGQGTLTLGAAAAANALTFAAAGATDGMTITYCIEEGVDFEIGRGVIGDTATTLTRATILKSFISGSAGTGKMELAGSAEVFCVIGAEDINDLAALAGRLSRLPEVVKTASWTVVAGDEGRMHAYNSVSGGTATLPAVATAPGALMFRTVGAGVLTIDPAGAEQIEGNATVTLAQGYTALIWPNEGKTAWRAAIMLPPSASGLGLVPRADAAQSLTLAQQRQVRSNIGALVSSVAAKSADYTVVAADAGALISVDASAANRIIALPSLASVGDGFPIEIKKSDTSFNTVTITGTVDGVTNKVLRLPQQSAVLVSDNTAGTWRVIAEAGTVYSGSTVNGKYTRYSDGTQLCWNGNVPVTYASASAAAGQWTFPVPFIDAETVTQWNIETTAVGNGTTSTRSYGTCRATTMTATSCFLRIQTVDGVTGSFGTTDVLIGHAEAKGRWF